APYAAGHNRLHPSRHHRHIRHTLHHKYSKHSCYSSVQIDFPLTFPPLLCHFCYQCIISGLLRKARKHSVSHFLPYLFLFSLTPCKIEKNRRRSGENMIGRATCRERVRRKVL